jgi:hypothetical protein
LLYQLSYGLSQLKIKIPPAVWIASLSGVFKSISLTGSRPAKLF